MLQSCGVFSSHYKVVGVFSSLLLKYITFVKIEMHKDLGACGITALLIQVHKS